MALAFFTSAYVQVRANVRLNPLMRLQGKNAQQCRIQKIYPSELEKQIPDPGSHPISMRSFTLI